MPTRALMLLDLLDRELVRSALRSVMISREPDLAVFDRAFDLVFAPGAGLPDEPDAGPAFDVTTDRPTAAALAADVGSAAARGDGGAMRALAARAVAMYGGDDASDRLVIHRIMRAIDLANMLSAVMRRLRSEGELSEFELSLRRHEIARALEEFRRALADEIAKSRLAAPGDGDDHELPIGALDRPVLSLSSAELAELRRTLQPLARQLAARIGRRRRPRSTGRLDPRRTFRRSLQTGGIPIDPALRRTHPHRPDVVVLCDISGSVAEFAQFTFTLVHAIHDVLAGVRSFAFVGGVADMTEIFTTANFDVPVQRGARAPRRRRVRRAQRLRRRVPAVLRSVPRRRRGTADDSARDRRRPHQLPRSRRGLVRTHRRPGASRATGSIPSPKPSGRPTTRRWPSTGRCATPCSRCRPCGPCRM